MRFSPAARRRSLFVVGALAGAGVLMGGALWSRTSAQSTESTSDIAPGLTLRAVQIQSAQGPLRFWLVKADPAKFELGLEIADPTDAQKKRTVQSLAGRSGATVAVNGGFFAYGGAAVGAVKEGGSWQRLPWKSRTALGWNSAKDARIGPLSGSCEVRIESDDGKIQLQNAALNGFSLPGTRTEIVDGLVVLTPGFARKYALKPGETALRIVNRDDDAATASPAQAPLGTVQSAGDVDLTMGEWIIARGAAAQSIDPLKPPQLSFAVRTSPDWSGLRHILGAGPRLISGGQPKTTAYEEEFRPDVLARGPRTCIGLDAQKNWLLLVADGRSVSSVGLTIPETATLFGQLGAVEAMNLDGGSSTQLVVNGALVNTPSGFDPANPTRPREVQVSNALVLKAK